MKYVKGILATIVILIIAAIGSTFFMSENFRVSQTQVINAPTEAVYNEIVTLKNWENWSYWRSLDDKMITTYNDIPSGVGASYSWKSDKKQVGNGSLTIERTVLNEYIQSRVKYDGKPDGFSEYIIRTTPNGTELTTAMNSKTHGIIDKFMARLFGKHYLTKAFKASADNMNTYLQSHPTTPKSTVTDSTTAKIN